MTRGESRQIDDNLIEPQVFYHVATKVDAALNCCAIIAN